MLVKKGLLWKKQNTLTNPKLEKESTNLNGNVGGSNGITSNEAEYINAILNMKVCELYIENSVSLRSIGTRFNIRIPKYHEKQCFHDFLAKHKLDPDSSYKTEDAYFELLNCLGY